MQKLRAGDKAEFARFVETYSGMIYRLALNMLEDSQDAEDILQETFIKAYRNLSKFDGRSNLSTWLYRIATNEALMMIRRRKKKFVSIDAPFQFPEQEQDTMNIVDWCCLPEDELMSSEALNYLNQSIDKLSPSLRIVFVLRDIEGLSTRETAEILKLSETAVKTRLSRARLRLRELLTSYYGERISTEEVQ